MVALDGAKEELGSVQEQLVQARSEIETIKAVAMVSENTKQEAIDQVRSQWQEEVASLQAIMKGSNKCQIITISLSALPDCVFSSMLRFFCLFFLLNPLLTTCHT